MSILALNILISLSVFACEGAKKEEKSAAVLPKVFLATSLPNEKDSGCVNPGGSCNGTLPCCDSANNACVHNVCKPVENSVAAK